MLAALFLSLGQLARADAQPTVDGQLGQLLYSTHCNACHTERMHWREKRLVSDWTSLRSQVRRWQEFAGLGWRNEEIDAVARYLNGLYYHVPAPDIR